MTKSRTPVAMIAAAALGTVSLCAQGLPVTYDRLVKAGSEPANWLMYSRTYDGARYSPLDQINTENVRNLHVKWMFQARTLQKFESTPLVVNGVMYLTRPENDVFALDARTGRVLWTYSHKNPEQTYNCCGKVNRGLAILGTMLFMNTLDMHLIALDARSGKEVWKTKIYDYGESGGYAATGAPLALKDKVIVGMAGGEHPITGFLDAYDAATGKRVWRFNTIPRPGEPDFGTWAGDSWKTGGVSTWNTGAYDPQTNTLYWGTSNPWPDYNRDEREGDNLYSCSVLALDPDTGKLKWFFQFTPHDTHDWDATQVPLLIDAPFRGQQRHLMAWAARNGFYYLLDRNSGQFLFAKNFVRQTWARGFDDKGRPDIIPGNDPTPEGSDNIFPGVDGGANWMSHSYSPLTKLHYLFARDERRLFNKYAVRHGAEELNMAPTGSASNPQSRSDSAGPGGAPKPAPRENNGIFGAGGNLPPGATPSRRPIRFSPEESWGKVVAMDPLTGTARWEHKVISPPWSGVMATAGNLVFGGTIEGVVFALDARTGQRLWYFEANDRVYSSPISYLVDGKQYVSLPVGDVLITFGL